jgi:methylenetetrahydrofolate reductase (NADPH)
MAPLSPIQGTAEGVVLVFTSNAPPDGLYRDGLQRARFQPAIALIERRCVVVNVDAGADYVCTQLYFDNRDFYDFCERCEIARITVPIIAGIMPVASLKGMQRMAELALGARFPARLIKSLVRAKDDEYVERVGIHWATEQVRDLIDHGVKGVHFYTLNRSKATLTIYETLGLKHMSLPVS